MLTFLETMDLIIHCTFITTPSGTCLKYTEDTQTKKYTETKKVRLGICIF